MKRLINSFKKFNNNNSGVTLIELIVAVLVLSIAIGPLLYTFVYSTKFNAQSKVRQRSTSAAQTVMEGFKAGKMEEIKKQFAGEETTNAEGATITTWSDPFLRNNSATYSFTSSGDTSNPEAGVYNIIGMKLSDVAAKEHGLYDAEVTVSTGLTSTNMADVPVFDTRQDGIWQEADSSDGKSHYDPYFVATTAVLQAVESAGLDASNVTSISISREIYLICTNSSFSVGYKYPYTLTYVNDSGVSTTYGSYVEYTVKSQTDTAFTMNMRNAYFYFFPAYSDTYGAGGTSISVGDDKMYICNTAGEINLFIYKQYNSSTNYFNLSSSESTYHLYCYNNGSSQVTNVYDCIQANLADVMGGNYTSHMSSMLRGNLSDPSNPVKLQTSVGPMKSGLMTYNVNVKIYKNGDHSKVLSEMTSTVVK